MESQYKPSNMDVVGVASNVKAVESSKKLIMMSSTDIMLRILGCSLTLVAAIVVGVDKETENVSITFIKTLPPVHVPLTAKWKYMSAFVYFLVSNVIACSYALLSLALSAAIRKFQNEAALGLIIIDLIIMGLLFSANGTAMAVGIVGVNGNSHVQWNKVLRCIWWLLPPNHCCPSLVSDWRVYLSLAGSTLLSSNSTRDLGR